MDEIEYFMRTLYFQKYSQVLDHVDQEDVLVGVGHVVVILTVDVAMGMQ